MRLLRWASHGKISARFFRSLPNFDHSINIKIKDLSIYYQFVLSRRISQEGMERLPKKYQRRTGNLLTMMILFKSLILIRNLQHRQGAGRGKLPRFLSIHVLRRCSRFTRSSGPKQGQSSMSTQTQSSKQVLCQREGKELRPRYSRYCKEKARQGMMFQVVGTKLLGKSLLSTNLRNL